MIGVEQWAEIRRLFFVEKRSKREIHRLTGRIATRSRGRLRAEAPPRYERAPAGCRSSIRSGTGSASSCGLTRRSSRSGCGRWRPSSGYQGGKSIFDDYRAGGSPAVSGVARTFQRTIYRPGELVQCDLWEPREHDPGRSRPVASRLGRDRASCAGRGSFAGTLIFSQGGAGHPVGSRPQA